jgi:hypothetical protein
MFSLLVEEFPSGTQSFPLDAGFQKDVTWVVVYDNVKMLSSRI